MRCRLYWALQDAVVTRLLGSPQARRFGSACNMGDYVTAECKAHRTDDVRAAIDRLERAGANGEVTHHRALRGLLMLAPTPGDAPAAIWVCLERAGVQFIPENGGGAWVRLRKADKGEMN